jgi:hypothetical protein
MYAFARENGHAIWKEWWNALMLRVSLQVDFYMTQKDQVFVANVVVIDSTQETMALSVITQPVSATTKLNTIANIRKYSELHERHHFILMAMKCITHSGMLWIVSSGSVLVFSTIFDQEIIYLCFFAFNFSSNMLILLFNML